MPRGELGRRLAVAGVGIPLVALLLYLGGWILAASLAVVSALITHELYRIAETRGVRAVSWIGIPASALLVLVGGAFPSFQSASPWIFAVLMASLLLSLASAIWLRWPEGNPLAATGTTLLGILYGGGALSFAVFLRHYLDTHEPLVTDLPLQGPILVAFPLTVTWIGDSAAYFLGSRMGKRKLIVAVSPGKTVEGGISGLAASVLVGGALGGILLGLHPQAGVSALLGAGVGFVLGIAAQVGDLAESVLKREAGVKDSGALLPGHGGAMDRFDALVFNLPMTYALISLIGLLS